MIRVQGLGSQGGVYHRSTEHAQGGDLGFPCSMRLEYLVNGPSEVLLGLNERHIASA